MHGAAEARRVLLVSAGMGGGHTQVARELQRRLTDRGHTCLVVDLLELMPDPAGRWLAGLYPWLVNRAPWLYDVVYDRFFLPRQRQGERAAIPVRLALPGLRRTVERFRPDAVVSTYHLAGGAVARLRARGELAAPALTFVTTFGVHDLWLHPRTDAYLCITEAAADQLRRRTACRVSVCEPVVRPDFTRPVERAGAPPGPPGAAKVALVVAGAFGMGSLGDAVRAVGTAPGWRAVVVCGRNEDLRRRLEAAGTADALGWVEDMASLMATADAVVDNAGGSTAKEALAMGVPVVTFRPIPGHGRDDALAMQRLGLTEVVDEAAGLVRALGAVTAPQLRADRVARGRGLFGADPADEIERWARRADGGALPAARHGSDDQPADRTW